MVGRRRLGTVTICEHGYGLYGPCPRCGHEAVLDASEQGLRERFGDEEFERLAREGEGVVKKALSKKEAPDGD